MNLDGFHHLRREVWKTFVDLIFPVNCRGCGKKLRYDDISSGFICLDCWKKIPIHRPPYCRRCGHPSGDLFHDKCPECKKLKKVYFRFARGVSSYSGLLRETIHRFKYRYQTELGTPLSEMMKDYYLSSNDYGPIDRIIPVPLHPIRFREREFNQAEILARPLAEALKVPLDIKTLYRTRYNPPQITLDSKARFENVQGLFATSNPDMIRNQRILLIDDVMTTGATVNACARTLMEEGASEVYVLVLARGD